MNRLHSELRRLYWPSAEALADDGATSLPLIDPNDKVRAMVMELKSPASWEVLGRVWHGVQSELELPAPAIAVSGTDGLQLWFSVAEAITVPQAHGFLDALRVRFLGDIDPRRIALFPASAASTSRQALHAQPVPALQQQTGNWSAFVAPDLAAVFAETPWLDIPPGDDGQAALLRSLSVMKQADFETAVERLAPSAAQPRGAVDQAASGTAATAAKTQAGREPANDTASPPHAPATPPSAFEDPQRFLLHVMNDDTVPLALRIEAAKALLLHSPTR